MPARVRDREIVVVVNVLVGLGSMKSVEVVVVIHCKHIAGPLAFDTCRNMSESIMPLPH